MHTADIQAELKKRNLTQKMIADELEIKPISVSNVVSRKSISSRVMCYVAKRIGRDPREVFPEYFLQPAKRRNSKVNI